MGDSLTFSTTVKGHHSGIEGPVTDAFYTATEFESFWRRHASDTVPPPACPEVDFNSSVVFCVFRGTKNSGGYGVEIVSVEEANDDEIVVTYETTDPPPGAITTCALTQPFHIVTVPKRSGKAVVFKEVAAPVEEIFPPYVVVLKDAAQKDGIAARIEKLDTVKNVQVLSSMGMVIVNFLTEKISKKEAKDLLEGLEGVKYVEEG